MKKYIVYFDINKRDNNRIVEADSFRLLEDRILVFLIRTDNGTTEEYSALYAIWESVEEYK